METWTTRWERRGERKTGKPSQDTRERGLKDLPNNSIGVGSRKVVGTDHMISGGPDDSLAEADLECKSSTS